MGTVRKVSTIFSLIIIAALIAPWIQAAEKIIIQISFFQGTWMEDQPRLEETKVLTQASHPELASLKAVSGNSEYELKALIIESLIDIMNLKTLDDLGSYQRPWSKKVKVLQELIVGKHAGYRFYCTPEWLSQDKLALQVFLFRSKEISMRKGITQEEKVRRIRNASQNNKMMERILDQKIDLKRNDPVILAVPYKDTLYFMMLSWTSVETSQEPEALEATAAPKPIHTVLPSYPNELREQGVTGEVELQIFIDKKGIVQGVKVVKSLHSFLDYSAAQALRQWKFEPGYEGDEPVPQISVITVNFDPKKWRRVEQKTEMEEGHPAGTQASKQTKLQSVLDLCAEYCRKLSNTALYFICEEEIKEIHYNMNTAQMRNSMWTKSWNTDKFVPGGGRIRATIGGRIQLMDSKLTEKNHYLCDYQLIKKGDQIKERRFLLKENGRELADKKKLLQEERFFSLNSLFTAVKLLGQDNQPLFYYRILSEDKHKGKKAYVIEAIPKSGNVSSIHYAKIWVEKKSGQVLKTEIKGVPFEGYDDVWKESMLLNVEPMSKITHIFKEEKNGVLFPEESTVLIQYPKLNRGSHTKMKIEMKYQKYKFFIVETDHEIIKKGFI